MPSIFSENDIAYEKQTFTGITCNHFMNNDFYGYIAKAPFKIIEIVNSGREYPFTGFTGKTDTPIMCFRREGEDVQWVHSSFFKEIEYFWEFPSYNRVPTFMTAVRVPYSYRRDKKLKSLYKALAETCLNTYRVLCDNFPYKWDAVKNPGEFQLIIRNLYRCDVGDLYQEKDFYTDKIISEEKRRKELQISISSRFTPFLKQ